MVFVLLGGALAAPLLAWTDAATAWLVGGVSFSLSILCYRAANASADGYGQRSASAPSDQTAWPSVDVGRCVGWLVCFAPDGVLNEDELLGVRLALVADEDLARAIVVTMQP